MAVGRWSLQGPEQDAAPDWSCGWRMDRGLLRYRFFALPRGLKPSERLQALQLKLASWSPFTQSSYCVAMLSTGASVWARDERLAQVHSRAAAAPWWPEVTAYQIIAPEGLVVQRCAQGVDLQWWQEGELRASRWRESMPDAESLLTFVRGAGGLLPTEPIQAQAARLSDFFWGAPRPWADLLAGDGAREQRWVSVVALLLLLPLGYQLALWRALSSATAETDAALTQVSAETRLVQADRLESYRLADALNAMAALQALRPDQPLATLLASWQAAATVGAEVRSVEWQGRSYRLTLQNASEVSVSDLLRRLESSGWVRAVRQSPNEVPGDLTMTGQLSTPEAATPSSTESGL